MKWSAAGAAVVILAVGVSGALLATAIVGVIRGINPANAQYLQTGFGAVVGSIAVYLGMHSPAALRRPVEPPENPTDTPPAEPPQPKLAAPPPPG